MRTDLRQRLAALLAEPDPVDLIGRGSHITCAGDPRRRQTIMLPLVTAWFQYRCLSVDDPDPYVAPAQTLSQRRARMLAFGRKWA